MGGTNVGFLSGFTGAIQNKIDQNHQEQEQKNSELRKGLWGIAYDPNQPEAVRRNAQEQLQKLYPNQKKGLQKFTDIFHRMAGAQAQPQQPPQPKGGLTEKLPSGQPAPGTAGSTGRTLPSPPPYPGANDPNRPQMDMRPAIDGQKVPAQRAQLVSPPQRQGGVTLPPIATDAELQASQDVAAKAANTRHIESEKADFDFWSEKGKDLGLEGRDLAQYAATKGQHIPPQQKRVMDKNVARPGTDPATGEPYKDLWDHIVEPDGSETWAKRPESSKARPTILSGDYVTLEKAKQLAAAGIPIVGDDGKPLDLEKIPKGMVLQNIHYPDGRTVRQPRSINERVVTVGGEKYAVNPAEISELSTGGGTDLGAANIGRTSTPPTVQIDAQGVPHVLGGTSAPVITGVRRGGGTQPTPATPQQPAAPPQAPVQTSPRSVLQSPASQADTGGARQAPGVTVGMDKDFRQTARTIQQALTQVVGDDNNPNLKTLANTAPKVLDDPKAVKRVGTAISMMLGEGAGGMSDAHVNAGASVGPVSFGLGGFGEYLSQVLNLPKKTAEQINTNLQNAMKGMSEDERQLVASTVAAFEESIAMRAINKSGVSNSQVSAIQRTLPLIGVNTFSKGDFATRMTNWVQQGMNGSWGVPPQYFRPDFINRMKQIPGEMEKMRGKGKGNLASPDDMEFRDYNGSTYQRKKGSNDDWKVVKKAA